MVVMTRALVVLLVLFTVPLIAMFGSDWVDRAKDLVLNHWPAPVESDAAAERVPVALAASDADSTAPLFVAAGSEESADIEPVVQSVYELQGGAFEGRADRIATNSQRADPIRQTSVQTPHPPSVVDEFGAIQERLRDLGAAYYCLGRSQEGGYRFHCEFDAAEEPFTAADADMLRSMQRVLQQVEAWKAGRSVIERRK